MPRLMGRKTQFSLAGPLNRLELIHIRSFWKTSYMFVQA